MSGENESQNDANHGKYGIENVAGWLDDSLRSGPDLTTAVYLSIASHRDTLVVGMLGSGKTHCTGVALRRAVSNEKIGHFQVIEANCEISKERILDHQLIIGADGKLCRRKALILCGRDAEPNYPPGLPEELKENWPAIRASRVTRPEGTIEEDPRQWWRSEDWWALFLTEAHRCPDEVLDALFSIVAEKKATVNEEEFYVPTILVISVHHYAACHERLASAISKWPSVFYFKPYLKGILQ